MGAKGQMASPAVAGDRPDIYKVFVKTAIGITLTFGCTLGAVNLALMANGGITRSVWGALNEVHGLAQLVGWVGLFIMGVVYHVLPRLKATELRGRPLAVASYWLVLASILLRVLALPLAGAPIFGAMVAASSVAGVLAATFFAVVALATLGSNKAAADFYDKYIVTSIGWYWIWTVAALALVFYQPGGRAGLSLRDTYLYVGLMGFATMMIFGISLRTLPGSLGLRPPNKATFGVIYWALNAGIAGHAAGSIWQGFAPSAAATALTVVAALVEYGAIVAFVYCLGIFGKPAVEIDAGAGRSYEPFIKAGYGWLLVAASMGLSYVLYEATAGVTVTPALVGAYRHALTVGFISGMMMGMAARMIPVFSGRRLHSPSLLMATFVLLNFGNALRVLGQPLAEQLGGPFFALMGGSGFLEVAALILFGYNIWRTIESRPAEAVASQGTRS